jgi:5-methylcytosine-specific restriction endonuclease McrA
MSPVRACNRHGRPKCQICARDRSQAAAHRQRPNRSARERASMAEVVLTRHGDLCLYCREPVDVYAIGGPTSLELAHVTAHADGGTWTADNLRAAHRSCNREAGR